MWQQGLLLIIVCSNVNLGGPQPILCQGQIVTKAFLRKRLKSTFLKSCCTLRNDTNWVNENK